MKKKYFISVEYWSIGFKKYFSSIVSVDLEHTSLNEIVQNILKDTHGVDFLYEHSDLKHQVIAFNNVE